MKRLTILFCLMMAVWDLSAQGVHFAEYSFDEAKRLALQEEKMIFVDVYTTWCGPCRRMSREVFVDEAVASYFNDHYICLKLDAEHERRHGFFELYTPSAYPSFYCHSKVFVQSYCYALSCHCRSILIQLHLLIQILIYNIMY